MAKPAYIVSAGMVTGVGFDAPSSCAAIRAGVTGFVETRFMFDEAWLIGCPVPFEEGWRGRERLLRMAATAVTEALAEAGLDPHRASLPLLLCLPEQNRPGRLDGLDGGLARDIEQTVGMRPHAASTWLPYGRVSGVQALEHARRLLSDGSDQCIVVGVDTLLVAETLAAMSERRLMQTPANSDGFIPGEAAAAVVLTPAPHPSVPSLALQGIGYGFEPAAADSGEPLRADGLVQAVTNALADAGLSMGQIDFRITDNSGSQYGFKESALLVSRVLHELKQEFDLWHPADCTGEVGAAVVPLVLAIALDAARKTYALGPRLLLHFTSDESERAAAVLAVVGMR